MIQNPPTTVAGNLSGKVRYINLSDGSRAIIDDDDTDLAMGYRWYRQNGGYVVAVVVTGNHRECVLLHRRITSAPPGTHVDHRDGDPLNNRRANLRVTTPSINQVNRRKFTQIGISGIRGVHFSKQASRWHAKIRVNGKQIHLGTFTNIEDAATARRKGELTYFGESCPTPEECQ